LGLDRIDILYIHDPDDHWEAAITGAFPALDRLRAEGVVRAIGAGMNQAEMLARFAREGDFDMFLVAGRYTLLDQAALPELLPLCVEKGIAVVIGGVMNSGILADPRPGARFNYAPAPPELVERAQRIRAVCERHGVPLRAAAIQFPLAHPAVAALVAGVRTVEHLDDYPRLMATPLPEGLWSELRAEGLIDPNAPVPGGR
jgi:D-threo-aldose 1-dehydrogenase